MSSLFNSFWQVPTLFFNFSQFPVCLPFQNPICRTLFESNHLLTPSPTNDYPSVSSSSNLASSTKPQIERKASINKQIRRTQERQEEPRGDENFSQRNQSKDRNLISYILKGYVHLVVESREMADLVRRSSESLNIKNGVSQFQSYIQRKFPSKRTYVGLRYVRQLLRQRATDPMTHLLTITLRYYLQLSYTLIVLHKQEITKRSRQKLLKKAKELQILLFLK